MKLLRKLALALLSIVFVLFAVFICARFYFAPSRDKITPAETKLSSITLTPGILALSPHSPISFVATGNYTDGTKRNLTRTAAWSSSDASSVQIGAGGIATALNPGHARIEAIFESQGGWAEVTVGPPALVGLAIAPYGLSIGSGKDAAYHATGVFSDGSSQDLTKSATWTSSAPAVAAISSEGLATVGRVPATSSTVIRASMGTISTSTFLTVTPNENGFAGVLTYHNDLARTGQNLDEVALKPSNVNSLSFGKLFTIAVDGNLYAQPLYMPNVTVPGRGVHNIVFAATENNSVYAVDAEDLRGETIWSVHLGPAVPFEKQAPGNCEGIEPVIGITSTPVIDPSTKTIYVTARTLEESGKFYYRMHALDLGTGAEKPGSPITISGSAPSTVKGSKDGKLAFDPALQLQRPGLALVNGQIYAGFGSNCDYGDYHGWIFRFDAASLQQTGIFLTTPSGTDGGIWAAGGAPAADADNHLYLITGDGTFDAASGGSNYGDSFLKMTPKNSLLTPVDYFTPNNQKKLDDVDLDLGSGGVVALPDQLSTHPHLMTGAGKEGTIYLVDRDALGHLRPDSNAQAVQCLTSALNPVFSTPAVWQDSSHTWIYYGASLASLKAYSLEKGQLSPFPSSQTVELFGSPGSSPVVSSEGTKDGIVWILGREFGDRPTGIRDYASRMWSIATHPKALGAFLGRMLRALVHPSMWRSYFTRKLPVSSRSLGQPVLLRAYDATNLSNLLYSSDQAANNRDKADLPVKFAVPTVANGRVYFGTRDHLDVYGLLK